jgi:hypothetical protein
MQDKKYVVLEHLHLPNRGFRFWSMNGKNNTHSAEGELWYKEVMFTDSTEEAIEASREVNKEAQPSQEELELYYKYEIEKRKIEAESERIILTNDSSDADISIRYNPDWKLSHWNSIFKIILLLGMIFLMIYEKDGWGWLLFILIFL